MSGLAGIWQAAKSPGAAQPFERLVPFSWRGELLVICGGMLLSFLIAGFWYPYWRIADMDFWVVYNAFLLNDYLPQHFVDHPGYFSILLLSYWLRALHALGALDVVSLSAVPGDVAEFERAWMAATQAGRVLSLMIAMGFVVSFAYLLRALVRDWRIAAVGGFMLAFSGGMAMQMRIMRTELIAVSFFFSALVVLMIAARAGERWWRPVVVGLAALLVTLAMENKIQVLFLICALPVILLPFGPDASTSPGFWRMPRSALPLLAAIIAISGIAAFLAKDIVVLGLGTMDTGALNLPPLPLSATAYWTLIMLWVALGMTGYAILWRVARIELLAAMFAAIAGCAIGLLALDLRFATGNAVVVLHPLEQMYWWAAVATADLQQPGMLARLKFLLEAIAGVVARRTFVLASSSRPTIFLEWFIIAATVVAIRRREWRLVLQVAALMLTDWGIDTLNMARGLKQEYFNFTDPLAIIAAALLIARLADLQRHRWTYPVGAALIAAHIVVSQAEPIKHVFRTEGRDIFCKLHGETPRLRVPFCPSQ